MHDVMKGPIHFSREILSTSAIHARIHCRAGLTFCISEQVKLVNLSLPDFDALKREPIVTLIQKYVSIVKKAV